MIRRLLLSHTWEFVLAGYVVLLIACTVLYLGKQGFKTQLAQERQAQAETLTRATQRALESEQAARAAEHQAQEALAVAQSQRQQEAERAEQLERDVVSAVRTGQQRLRASVAAATCPKLPGAAAANGAGPQGADDGARRIGAAVRRLADGDAEIRYWRAYADQAQRTCGSSAVNHGR